MKKTANNGLGLGTTLFLIFLVFKLVGVGPIANWSWWWVTCPLWVGFALFICIFLLIGAFLFLPFTVGLMSIVIRKTFSKKD